MKAWQEDQLQEFERATDERAILNAMAKLAQGLGFDVCAAAVRIPLPVSSPKFFALTNYPARWQTTYVQNGYSGVDPVLRRGLASSGSIVWSDALFTDTQEFWEEARAAGIGVGWTQPAHGANNVIGLFSLARSTEAITAAEVEQKQFRLAWFAQASQISISRHVVPAHLPAGQAKLTNREITVLRWIADGKSSADIAEILRLSERTVHFHTNNAIIKLGTTNRTAAAVAAALLGIL